MLLPERPPGRAGRRASHGKREIVDAILHHVYSGGAWRALPKDFPPWQTVYAYFREWQNDGTLQTLRDALRERAPAAKSHGRSQAASVFAEVVAEVGQREVDRCPRIDRLAPEMS